MKNILSQFNIYTFVILAIFPIITYSQNTSEVKIGTQIWTTKNLDVSTFRNGDSIPEVKNAEEWKIAGEKKTALYCYYDYDSKNGKVYGKLYNWYAVNDSRGLAPKGYHIPSHAEWTNLTDMLGGEAIAGEKLKSKTGWHGISNSGKKVCLDCADWIQSYRDQVPCHTCKNTRIVKIPEVIKTGGDNSCGFNGLPGGYCNNDGYFNNITEVGFFWSSSEDNKDNAWYRGLYYDKTKVGGGVSIKGDVFLVRCIRD